MLLKGSPGDPDTCKCLYLAAEKNIQLNTDFSGVASAFRKLPHLHEGEQVFSSAAVILPYLDIKGGGASLVPKKAAHLGEQNYWIQVGQTKVQPALHTLINTQLLQSPAADPEAVADALTTLDQVFSIVDQHLENRQYLAGNFSLADIHWAPYLHFCQLCGPSGLMDKYPHLKAWFARNKARKNKDQVVTTDVFPKVEHIKGQRDAA